jgi:Na+/H+ antiporter NhaD/arsenite permease-like protein
MYQLAIIENTLGMAAIISAIIFIVVIVMISLRLLHETTAALLGVIAVFLITYVGGQFNSNLRIMTFNDAMLHVDWNVIFLIMGMMIFMAILAETNVFKWIALNLYRFSKGNTWVLVVLLVTLTGFTSALLNDVTAILLLVPLSIQLAAVVGINPFAIVIAEILASNIGGAATLIGDPPSTIVGLHVGISFGEYLINMAPVAIICMVALIIINRFQYRKEYAGKVNSFSDALVEKLTAESQIVNHSTLYKSLFIGTLMFVLFFVADSFGHMPPGVVALTGAGILIAWVRPDLDDMVREVDWTTLLFFIGLFIIVGGMEVTGVIDWLATRILLLAGDSVTRATLLVTWVTGIASGIVANIPFTVAVLPIIDLLSTNLPGAAESKILDWALILGADLGGNSTYLGSAPNIVAVGLLAQAGYRLSFGRFMRDGVPITIVTLIIASIWLLLRY